MKTVTFGDDALFYRYDRGWQVASRGLRYSSHQPADSDGVALWFVQAVGDPTVPSTQEIGVADYAERTTGRLALALRQGGREFSALDLAGARRPDGRRRALRARRGVVGLSALGDELRAGDALRGPLRRAGLPGRPRPLVGVGDRRPDALYAGVVRADHRGRGVLGGRGPGGPGAAVSR